MSSPNDDHIDLPSAISDRRLKREYGRELAFNSLMKGCFEAEKARKAAEQTLAEDQAEQELQPTLKLPKRSDAALSAQEKTIPFPDRSKRKISKRMLLAIAASLVAVTAPLWLQNKDSMRGQNPRLILTVESIKGDVTIKKAGSKALKNPKVGDIILSGDRIVTDRKSRVRLLYPDGTSIQLTDYTDLLNRINPDNPKAKSLNLARGRITVNAKKQPTDARLTILTPTAVAEVVGTIFILKATEDHTELIVNEGIVDLKRNKDSMPMKVEAGLIAHVNKNNEQLQVISPVITSFSLIDIKTGQPLPGYEEVMGDTLISYTELPATGVGIKANISGLTDMVEMQRPDQKHFQKQPEQPESPFESQEPEFIGYKAIDTTINPFPITATPYSRREGAGEAKKLRVFFTD